MTCLFFKGSARSFPHFSNFNCRLVVCPFFTPFRVATFSVFCQIFILVITGFFKKVGFNRYWASVIVVVEVFFSGDLLWVYKKFISPKKAGFPSVVLADQKNYIRS